MPTPNNSSAQAVLAALSRQPGSTAAEVAERSGLGRSTAAKCLAVLEQQGAATRSPGGRTGGRREPDRWALEAAAPGPGLTDERLGRGQLAELVEGYLASHPGDELSATAVSNALGRLVKAGRANLVSASPRRYRHVAP